MADLTLSGMLGAADSVTQNFLARTYPALASAVATPIYLAAVLYWALYGYKIYAGHAPVQWKDFLAKAVMTIGVFGALNWGGFAQAIYSAFVTFMESAAATIAAGESTATMLDALTKNMNAVADTLMKSSWMQIAMILNGFVLFALNCILFLIALFYMTIAKFGLAITMALLPLFVGFFFFEQTRHWATNWLNKMLTFCLLYILVVAIVRLGFLAFADTIATAAKAAESAKSVTEQVTGRVLESALMFQLFVIDGILILFMLAVRGWAAALASGAASSTGVLMMVVRAAVTKGVGK